MRFSVPKYRGRAFAAWLLGLSSRLVALALQASVLFGAAMDKVERAAVALSVGGLVLNGIAALVDRRSPRAS